MIGEPYARVTTGGAVSLASQIHDPTASTASGGRRTPLNRRM